MDMFTVQVVTSIDLLFAMMKITLLFLLLNGALQANNLETCRAIPFNRLKIFKNKEIFEVAIDRLYGRRELVKSFTSNKAAQLALNTIRVHKFTQICKIGDGAHSMEYWKQVDALQG